MKEVFKQIEMMGMEEFKVKLESTARWILKYPDAEEPGEGELECFLFRIVENLALHGTDLTDNAIEMIIDGALGSVDDEDDVNDKQKREVLSEILCMTIEVVDKYPQLWRIILVVSLRTINERIKKLETGVDAMFKFMSRLMENKGAH